MAWLIGRNATSKPSEDQHKSPDQQLRNVTNHGKVLTDQEALRLYSLSAAELEKLGDDGWLNENRHQISVNDLKQTETQGKYKAELYREHLTSEYDGGMVRKRLQKYSKPTRTFDEEEIAAYTGDLGEVEEYGKRPFLNPVGEVVWKYEDVDTYLSPESGIPRRLIVQATDAACHDHPSSSWRRTEIKGTVPLALRMAQWSLEPSLGRAQSFLRQALVAVPLQVLLALPGANAPWEMNDFEASYQSYPAYHWKWPKHAINPLDTREEDRKRCEKPEKISSKQRLNRPRRLLVRQDDGEWKLDENPPKQLQYIFISYHWGSFQGQTEDKVSIMAQAICEKEGLRAYFQDKECNASKEDKDLLTAVVNRMCDIIRGSKFVALLLPDDQSRRKLDWGGRMWTLPEGLLAPGKLHVCTWLGRDIPCDIKLMNKVELTSEFWEEAYEGGEEAPGRILAEHFEGSITLSRLELFSAAVSALKAKTTSTEFTRADMAYALMGLLHYRVDPDPTDDLFQIIARLSLANDNDGLIERLISMFPKAIDNKEQFIRSFADKDRYETHCWDIEPRCRVVGVADEPDSVILNECRSVPIRWKRFPRMMYKRHIGVKKRLAELLVRSGAWWLATACALAITYAAIFIAWAEVVDEINDVIDDIPPVQDESISDDYKRWLWAAILLFLGVSLVLAIFAPHAVRRLFGGPVLQTAPYLVAFEGTMPRSDLERIIFDGDAKRLRYDPSSTPFARQFRHRFIRKGIEPDWITQSQPQPTFPGHRWFTLVDTGNLTISVFQAKRPPTVALITGADGGMLRAVLCSWRFANDCHYRETVIRVPSNTWRMCNPSAWVKVSLHSQEDLFAVSNRPRTGTADKSPHGHGHTPEPSVQAPT
jgi:hypothetical protein